MKAKSKFSWINFNTLIAFLLPFLLYWFLLQVSLPFSFTHYFHNYSIRLFLLVFILYCIAFQISEAYRTLVCFGLTVVLFSLSLSYMWTSGFSDNFIIAGLLPYKDGKNYYFGANLLLNGLPILRAGQATERPLFPGFLASVLWLTDQNLKLAVGFIVQCAAVGLYVSARQIRNSFGAVAASLFAALLYFYIQPWIGYSLSELLGFIAGCLGFSMIWLATSSLKKTDLMLGGAVLLLGISARAGAFLILPMLVIWIGWIFRGEQRFSFKAAAYTVALIAVMYFLMNSLYSRVLGIPPGYSFANFAYAIYGQVRGGTGWHAAIQELGTRDPGSVYHAAWKYFIKHPISLFIGFTKAYRDFFLLVYGSLIPRLGRGWQLILNITLQLGLLALFIRGIVQLLKSIYSKYATLLLAGFLGVFLSIPFLPPIDGGLRFHAGTIPFFFTLLVVGAWGFPKKAVEQNDLEYDLRNELIFSRYASVTLCTLVLIVPLLIYTFSKKPAYSTLSCSAGLQPFVIEMHPSSYVDLVKEGSTQCSAVPEVCLKNFEGNNPELVTDDFYQSLITLAKRDNTNIRLIPAIDLIKDQFHYFYVPLEQISSQDTSKLITGCATEIKTKNQSIFQVKSVFPNKN